MSYLLGRELQSAVNGIRDGFYHLPELYKKAAKGSVKLLGTRDKGQAFGQGRQ